MALGIVRVLGWLVIAHGLSHAVLPLRGSLAPAMLVDDWTPVVLYGIAMVGFVAAGLGILGLRPLDSAISPLLVLASGLSLVAIVRFADPSLWFGGACDVAILLLGLWRAYGGWPQHPAHGRIWHAAGLLSGFALLLYVTAASFSYPWHRTWGSTRDELAMALPGDPAHRDPALEVQRAVTIDAPADEVRSWLAQENPGAFVLLPVNASQTRLIVRSTVSRRNISVWESALNLITFQLPHFIMERRMLLTVKALAEERHALRAAAR
jgi:hypothetical protein